MNIGDTVRIIHIKGIYANKIGTIIDIYFDNLTKSEMVTVDGVGYNNNPVNFYKTSVKMV